MTTVVIVTEEEEEQGEKLTQRTKSIAWELSPFSALWASEN